MVNTEFAGEFNRRIRAVGPLGSRSSTKFVVLQQWLEQELGLPPDSVAIKYVSAEKQIGNRLGELANARPDLVLLLATGCRLEVLEEKLQKRVGSGNLFKSGAIATVDENDKWVILRLLGDAPGEVVQTLRQAFPDLVEWKAPAAAAMPAELQILYRRELIIDERTRRMVQLSIASAPAVILVGPPGTGKSTLLREIIEDIRERPKDYGFMEAPEEPRWVTPEESWTTRELVGGETIDESGQLRFRPGFLLEAIRNDQWLVLDEANRADMDKIFGGMLTWLAGQNVLLGRASTRLDAPSVELGWSSLPACSTENFSLLSDVTSKSEESPASQVRFLAGTEWRLLGTYNAVDAHRIFRFGHALGRRFVRVPIPPIGKEDFRKALEPSIGGLPDVVGDTLTELYSLHLENGATTLGPAVFLQAPAYVRSGMRLSKLVRQPSGDDADLIARLIAETYLTAAGPWLSRLSEEELDELGARVVERGVMAEDQWSWIRKLLPTLG